jgi:hypothetical protein
VKLPPDIFFKPQIHLLVWRPRGLLNETAVNKIIGFIRDVEARSEDNELRFIDTRELTAVALNFRYVFHIALYRRMSRMGKRSIKSAFFIKNPEFEHYFKLHAVLTDHSPLQVRLFDDRKSAAEWLNVSLKSLERP